MTPRLTGIDRDEALRYLGWKGGAVAEETIRALDRCAALLLGAAQPRAVWRLFERSEDGELVGAGFALQGKAVRALLDGCGQVVLMAATLGAQVDALLRRAQVEDMARAVMLDACASAAIENVCDNLCADIAAQVLPKSLTERFSPGYGDLPLAQQADFCRVLDTPRRIGVSLTPGGLMVPQKSVTALMGVADSPAAGRRRRGRGACESCALASTCAYRKDGQRCGKD